MRVGENCLKYHKRGRNRKEGGNKYCKKGGVGGNLVQAVGALKRGGWNPFINYVTWFPWLIHWLLAFTTLTRPLYASCLCSWSTGLTLRKYPSHNVQSKQMHLQWSLQIICTYKWNSYLEYVSDSLGKTK